MATIQCNALVDGIRGSVGRLVFRKIGGKTIVSQKARPARTQSDLQKKNRTTFRDAAVFAKRMMFIPDRKAYYKKVAIASELPNAYTAAVREYLREQHNPNKLNGDSIHDENVVAPSNQLIANRETDLRLTRKMIDALGLSGLNDAQDSSTKTEAPVLSRYKIGLFDPELNGYSMKRPTAGTIFRPPAR